MRGRPTRFLTLTVQAPAITNDVTWTPREAFDATRRKCGYLFKKMATITGKKTEYVRILEETKAGYPHYHYLTRGPYWHQKTISQIWERLTGSFVVDIRRPPSHKAACRYVAKYLTKQTTVEFTQRRVTFSRQFVSKNYARETVATDWKRLNGSWNLEVQELLQTNEFFSTKSPHRYQLLPLAPDSAIPPVLAQQLEDHEERTSKFVDTNSGREPLVHRDRFGKKIANSTPIGN